MSKIHFTDFNELNGTHVKDVEDYRNICIVVSCINVKDVEDIFIYNLTVLNGMHVEDIEDICMQCNTVYCTLNDKHVEDVGDDKNTYYIDF